MYQWSGYKIHLDAELDGLVFKLTRPIYHQQIATKLHYYHDYKRAICNAFYFLVWVFNI